MDPGPRILCLPNHSPPFTSPPPALLIHLVSCGPHRQLTKLLLQRCIFFRLGGNAYRGHAVQLQFPPQRDINAKSRRLGFLSNIRNSSFETNEWTVETITRGGGHDQANKRGEIILDVECAKG